MVEFLSFIDLVIPVIFLVVIYLFAKKKQMQNIETNPSYKYYIYGLMAKIFGGVSVCLIYALYYGFGDTVNYYNDCVVLLNLGEKSIMNISDLLSDLIPLFFMNLIAKQGVCSTGVIRMHVQ